MRKLTDTKIFTAIIAKFSVRTTAWFDFGEDTHRKQWEADKREFKTWELVFGTYEPNVPEQQDHTVEEALALADDPALLKVFPPPFYITALDMGDRSVLSLGRHASGTLAHWVQQPGEYPLSFLVIKASAEEPAFTADIMEEVTRCTAPEKHIYGCKACLESSTEFEKGCVFKRTMCPQEDPISSENRYYSHRTEAFLPSRKYWVKDHIFVSPVMLHDKSERKFQGLNDIKFSNLDFSYYGEHYEKKCEALVERQKTLNNGKVYCKTCSMFDECTSNFKWKMRGCCNPRPSLDEIATEIINRCSPKISKRTIAEILDLSGKHTIQNQRTGRKSRATIGLTELNRGLGFCVHRVSDNQIIASGITDTEWEEFKHHEKLEAYEGSVTQTLEKMEDPLTYAMIIACANVKGSPRRVTIWRSTSYEYMYSLFTYSGDVVLHFHKPSSRDVAPWPLEIRSLTTLFEHYGRIPGSIW
jgi:hypothetical protein